MAFYRKLDNFSKLEAVSGMAALKHAGYTITDENATKLGIVVGTSEGALGMGCLFEENIASRVMHLVVPLTSLILYTTPLVDIYQFAQVLRVIM